MTGGCHAHRGTQIKVHIVSRTHGGQSLPWRCLWQVIRQSFPAHVYQLGRMHALNHLLSEDWGCGTAALLQTVS